MGAESVTEEIQAKTIVIIADNANMDGETMGKAMIGVAERRKYVIPWNTGITKTRLVNAKQNMLLTAHQLLKPQRQVRNKTFVQLSMMYT